MASRLRSDAGGRARHVGSVHKDSYCWMTRIRGSGDPEIGIAGDPEIGIAGAPLNRLDTGCYTSEGAPNVCPHGRPIVKRVALADLLREFGRLQRTLRGHNESEPARGPVR